MILKPSLIEQGQVLFTQDEFNNELALAKAEIMMVAIETTKKAILIERDACAELAEEITEDTGLAYMIRNRLNKK